MTTKRYGYRNLLAVELTWDPTTRTGTANIILAWIRIGLNLGVTINTELAG